MYEKRCGADQSIQDCLHLIIGEGLAMKEDVI